MPSLATAGTRRAYVVWAVGVTAFTLSVMHRTTLGVAGIKASERLEISPAVLSAVMLSQTVVFLVLHIPSGMLVDRWGSRVCPLCGSPRTCVISAACGRRSNHLVLDEGTTRA